MATKRAAGPRAQKAYFGKGFREQAYKDAAKGLAEEHRRTLAKLRKQLGEAKPARKKAHALAKKACKRCKDRATLWAKQTLTEALKRVRARILERKNKAIARCQEKKIERLNLADKPIADLLAKRAEERARWEEHRKFAAPNAREKEKAKRAKAAERLRESDDAVLQEIPERLIPLWQRVKGSIKGTERWSRAEAFLHFAEEHPDEVIAAIEADVAAELAAIERTAPKSGRRPRKVAEACEVNERPLSPEECAAIDSDADWDRFDAGLWAA